MDSGVTLIQQVAGTTSNAITNDALLSKALGGVPALTSVFPANNPLATQLQQVAKLIEVRQVLGMQRQIFFCSLGGFDTHSNQLADQARLLGQLSTAVDAFFSAMQEIGTADQVVLFTESDFSRTFQANTNGGTDHAWGSNHLVVGNAVRGGQVYGSFPEFALSGPNDAGNGRWIPQYSVDQYGATLASWFGAAAGQLNSVFPNLPAFSVKNLGFLG